MTGCSSCSQALAFEQVASAYLAPAIRATAGAGELRPATVTSELAMISRAGRQALASDEAGQRRADQRGRERVAASDASDATRTADPAGGNAGEPVPDEDQRPTGTDDGGGERPSGRDGQPLDDRELEVVEQLQARDREVRVHERAHIAAGGGHTTGGPTFTYQTGPDGRRYAVGGEVGIDASPVPGDPQATIRKMAQVRRAALAPAEPSAQDRRVAAIASQSMAQASQELMQLRAEQARQAYGQAEALAAEQATGSEDDDEEEHEADDGFVFRPIGDPVSEIIVDGQRRGVDLYT